MKDQGATGDGTTDDTASVAAAIAAVGAAGGGIVFFPPGTYVRSASWELPANVWIQGAGQGATTIKVKAGSTNVTAFGLGQDVTNTRISDLTIDGNKAAQTASGIGIVGWHSHDNAIVRVTIVNQNGIGIGLSGCWHWTVSESRVEGSGDYQPGVWCDVDTGVDPFNRGCHRFERMVCSGNDLDGMICNSPGCTIIDSEFVDNGVNVPSASGALGAGGIYNDNATRGTTVVNCRMSGNTEFGLNMVLTHSLIQGNLSERNALSGLHVRAGSAHVTFTGNVCRDNGTASSTVSAYSNSGISFDNSASVTFTGNECSDDDTSPTQEWGIHALDYTGISQNVLIVGNTLSPNKLGAENVSGSTAHTTKTVLGNQ
ncbi:glycosyl hydrolase family 28-related protein [Leifsonia aquatica]|uniref:glycosyl hydrolase family 28-related protein n=1 Tax=Leifsonia aquatica TaxID=144185 RepID=UPI00046A8BE8|nr:right-handed parallel beta-helix repeat-containing protein [Leifsonia aquatica]